jgi:hypothetical protein
MFNRKGRREQDAEDAKDEIDRMDQTPEREFSGSVGSGVSD